MYRDRVEAGRLLAAAVAHYSGRSDVLVIGLPRGGVPVAHEIARALRAPLDVLVVRKLGAPGHPELAMGALAPGGVRVLEQAVIRVLHVSPAQIEATVAAEQRELERREQAYRAGRGPLEAKGRIAIVVDDGLATGSTMRAAIAVLRQLEAKRVVVAVPVGATEACADLEQIADEVVCALTPDAFHAVGLWYRDFTPTTDADVREILATAERELAARGRRTGAKPAVRGGSREARP